MVRLSEETIKLLRDDIVSILYENPLKPMFTIEIAKELRRDKEFTKQLLENLKKEGIVENIKINKRSQEYILRKKWKLRLAIVKMLDNQ